MNQTKFQEFEPIFFPRSIAVVGASKDVRKTGHLYLKSLADGDFKGKLYAVNPTGGEILGVRVFPSLSSIPETVDYVIVNIPKRFILDLLDECHTVGVKVAQIFSAGFSESGEAEGNELEMEIIQKAKSLGIRIIGPNCIGVYSPRQRMSPAWLLPPQAWEVGTVAFLCQSGGHTGFFIDLGLRRGIRFSKVVSFGNGNDLGSIDFLEYFGADPETKIIGAYLEGMKDGPRFLQLVREISQTKPIVIWKGGITDAGARTAASHTASLAGSDVVWRAGLKQSGAIKVESVEELADTILAFQQIRGFEGNRVAVIGGLVGAGGGASVAAADACVRQGLDVPVLTEQTISRLKQILPAEGSIYQNPVDVGAVVAMDLKRFADAVEAVFADPNVDVVIIHVPVTVLSLFFDKESLSPLIDILVNLRMTQGKPLIILSPSAPTGAGEELEKRCFEARIPTYPTFEQAAKAIANVIQYWKFRSEVGQG